MPIQEHQWVEDGTYIHSHDIASRKVWEKCSRCLKHRSTDRKATKKHHVWGGPYLVWNDSRVCTGRPSEYSVVETYFDELSRNEGNLRYYLTCNRKSLNECIVKLLEDSIQTIQMSRRFTETLLLDLKDFDIESLSAGFEKKDSVTVTALNTEESSTLIPALVTNEQIIAWCEEVSSDASKNLTALLKDPHPGLYTWRLCLQEATRVLIEQLVHCPLKTVLLWKMGGF